MKRVARTIVTLLILGSALGVAANQAQDPARLFKQAMDKEVIDHNLPEAIELYKKVVVAGDRALAAQALLRMAECYERLGSQEAQKIYAELTSKYSDQRDVAAQARARLAPGPQSVAPLFAVVPIDSRVPLGSVLSPDGQMVLVSAGEALSITDLRTGTRQVLPGTERTQAGVWSPDGRRIAFERVDGPTKTVEIRTVTIRTGGVRTVASRPSFPGPMNLLAWTTRDEIVYRPDSRPVVFVPVAGGTTTEIGLPESTPFRGSVDVLPDGSALVVAAGEQLIRIDRATRREQVLTRGFPVSTPRISPDGRLVAYISNESGQSALRVAPLTSGEILRSVEIAKMPPGRNRDTRWTADGRLATDAVISTSNIYGMRLDDSGPPRRLIRLVHSSGGTAPTITPNDRQIVYFGNGGLNVMNADGSGERPLGVSGLPVGWLSTDELVFWHEGPGAVPEGQGLRAVSLRTGTIRSIGFDGPLNADAATPVIRGTDGFQYLPARNELVIRRATSDRILFLSRRPGESERLWFEMPPVGSSRISPKGDRLAYSTGGSSTQPTVLHVKTIGRDDSKVVGEVQRPGSERWTADGRQLFYLGFSAGNPVEFRRYDVESGETTVLVNRSHLEGASSSGSALSLGACQLATNLAFVVCTAGETTVERLAWTGVTFDAVMARLGTK